jgi:hypothetical protein
MCYGSKNIYQNEIISLKEIGLHAQHMIIILGSIVNIIGEDLYDHLMSTRITFASEYYIHTSSENYEEGNYSLDLDLLTISY